MTMQLVKSFSLVLLGFSFSVFASGCPVNLKNIQFCADKGKLGAVCAYWHNAKGTKKRIKKSDWDQKRIGMFCTSPEGLGEINAMIEKFCQSRECRIQTEELIKALRE